MFRSEQARERVLLRLIQDQQNLIRDLADRLALLSGQPVPQAFAPAGYELPEEEEAYASALEGMPPNMRDLEEG
jgi:hypothetical protein